MCLKPEKRHSKGHREVYADYVCIKMCICMCCIYTWAHIHKAAKNLSTRRYFCKKERQKERERDREGERFLWHANWVFHIFP